MNQIYIPKSTQSSVQKTENERIAEENRTLHLEKLELLHIVNSQINEKRKIVKSLKKMMKNSELGIQQTTLNLQGLMNIITGVNKTPTSYHYPSNCWTRELSNQGK